MRIQYLCHACLLIDTGDVKIVTDPWFVGSAYCGQWHLFPKPVDTDILQQAEVVLLSHGHEDHFHEPSLKSLPKSAQVFHPYSWYGGAQEFLQRL
jgi:L-ascorbate metabolism protein UlaG (beta-lactamase superfamily)